MRGAAFFLLAALALLLFDNDVTEAPDGTRQPVGLPLLASHLLGTLAVADHKVLRLLHPHHSHLSASPIHPLASHLLGKLVLADHNVQLLYSLCTLPSEHRLMPHVSPVFQLPGTEFSPRVFSPGLWGVSLLCLALRMTAPCI